MVLVRKSPLILSPRSSLWNITVFSMTPAPRLAQDPGVDEEVVLLLVIEDCLVDPTGLVVWTVDALFLPVVLTLLPLLSLLSPVTALFSILTLPAVLACLPLPPSCMPYLPTPPPLPAHCVYTP